mmetsp:Transcript_14331/g.46768  ORF Transcript_14331/g.46768 Transcript_14331/m.46768 type:complete len:260 (+) Transcript_14331:419-1198(+)
MQKNRLNNASVVLPCSLPLDCLGCSALGSCATVPIARWDVYADSSEGTSSLNRRPAGLHYGSFVPEWNSFILDRATLKVSPAEVKTMDPQHMQLLTGAYSALADADGSEKCLTSVFVGISGSDYGAMDSAATSKSTTAFSATGKDVSVAAGRISFYFDLNGPAAAVDTACSSTLVALHLGMREHSCDRALVVGVNMMLTSSRHAAFSAAGMLSSYGRCHTFDHRADGYVRAEGIGTFLLSGAGVSGLACITESATRNDG